MWFHGNLSRWRCQGIRELRPEFLNQIAGTSCGALVGAAVLSNCELDHIASMFFDLASKGRSYTLGPFNPSFNLHGTLRNLLEKYYQLFNNGPFLEGQEKKFC